MFSQSCSRSFVLAGLGLVALGRLREEVFNRGESDRWRLTAHCTHLDSGLVVVCVLRPVQLLALMGLAARTEPIVVGRRSYGKVCFV